MTTEIHFTLVPRKFLADDEDIKSTLSLALTATLSPKQQQVLIAKIKDRKTDFLPSLTDPPQLQPVVPPAGVTMQRGRYYLSPEQVSMFYRLQYLNGTAVPVV